MTSPFGSQMFLILDVTTQSGVCIFVASQNEWKQMENNGLFYNRTIIANAINHNKM